MNKIVEKAYEMQAPEYKAYIPELEVGEECELNDVWDGDGDVPERDYTYQLTDTDWINYVFEIIEEKENPLDTVVKITNIELI